MKGTKKVFQVFLPSDYRQYYFCGSVNEVFDGILQKLLSNMEFSSTSLSHLIDGLIIKHPILQTRIVEFDEEQHFTPARKETLQLLNKILPDQYLSKYMSICNDLSYVNDQVLRKNRIKQNLTAIPNSFVKFQDWLEQNVTSNSGYISEKKGFDFLGGRIAQRAYYDSLRDVAHLSSKNEHLHSPLRFAKKTFEDYAGKNFANISVERLADIIQLILKEDYNIVL